MRARGRRSTSSASKCLSLSEFVFPNCGTGWAGDAEPGEVFLSEVDRAHAQPQPHPHPPQWPPRPKEFGELLTPVEAAQYLRLDELGTHTPDTAVRTLKFWRDRGDLRATKYARH